MGMTDNRAGHPFGGVFAGARVLVTGHTGFKGSWLCEWLLALGAEVTGFALEPDTVPSLFRQLDLTVRLRHHVGDIRSPEAVARIVLESRPQFVFHLAAQPLVRRSYREARYTWETNVMGTIHVLEALRRLDEPCAAVIVTSDKCYENRDWYYGYRENDPLGGHDPYSSSKAGAELAVSSWRGSFFGAGHPVRIASARAGNVIGGGDWSPDRLIPDCIRALERGEDIEIRHPRATRPWQHVLEPLSGYVRLAVALEDKVAPTGSSWNFGPPETAVHEVHEVAGLVAQSWGRPEAVRVGRDTSTMHESQLLQLNSQKAHDALSWSTRWDFTNTMSRTTDWYRSLRDGAKADALTLADMKAYLAK